MADVICLGELLVDFVAERRNVPLEHVVQFRRAPGGAPANVACGVAKLGGSAAFIGKVGDDPFGRLLREALEQTGVDTSHLATTPEARTTLVFVAVHDDGHKDMCFYRHPGADMLLEPGDVDEQFLASARAFHFGSISLMSPSAKAATLKAARAAREAGLLVTYDPNYRARLWRSEDEARRTIREGIRLADVVKISDEEWPHVTGTGDFEAGAADLVTAGARLIVASRGDQGCFFFSSGATPGHISHSGGVPGFGVEAVETTGAGDGFMASLIVDLLAERDAGRNLDTLDEPALTRILTRANAVGALTCTRAGAIPGLPTREEVDQFLAQVTD